MIDVTVSEMGRNATDRINEPWKSKKCACCKYWAKITGWRGFNVTRYCAYSSVKGHSRGCAPGDECEVYLPKRRRRYRYNESV